MEIHKENIKKYDAKLFQLSKFLKRLSYLRLSIFIISLAVLIYLASFQLFTVFFVILPVSIVLFGITITHYNKTAYLRDHTSFLKKINEDEILRGNCNLDSFDKGKRFINAQHAYTSDLDIFGPHSIFQLVNRTTTESGKILLAKWLSQPASKHEIIKRQVAIKELSEKSHWRQSFQAAGMYFENKKSDYYKLLKWVKAPIVLLQYKYILKTITFVLLALFLTSFYLFYVNIYNQKAIIYCLAMILVLLTNFLIIRKLSPLAEHIVDNSTKNLETLRGYKILIHNIANEDFKSEKLKKLKNVLKVGKHDAFHEINQLCNLLDFSQQRGFKKHPLSGNSFYPILNIFLLLDIHLIIDTEKWKFKNKATLKSWADVISEFEVINSFAGFHFANPSYQFPEIIAKKNEVHFDELGHPLIKADRRICNDFHSEGAGDIAMVTGSNMAGKSTFLRAVGVNIVLSMAGAPCCAKNASVSNLQLFSSMRTEDNLHKGISSFYAELNRIQKMLIRIENHENVFFLLDEMFKGTNSKDRHRGGFSFISQISKLKTSGIIATHDIELAKIAETEELVTNYSFNSKIKDDSMIFNYKLTPGICIDFNASVLMEKIGIKIIPKPL